MRIPHLLALVAAAIVTALAVTGAWAVPLGTAPMGEPIVVQTQAGPNGLINPIRDCQTIRTCRYERGGSYRGCVSTYSCKVCRLVDSRCEIGGRTQNCREMRCSWGG